MISYPVMLLERNITNTFASFFKGFSRKWEVHCKGPGGCKGKFLLWIMWQAVSQAPGIW